jgi:alcohol dehydrogenase
MTSWCAEIGSIPVEFGAGCLERLGEAARELGGFRALVVTDPGLLASGHVERGLQSLIRAGLRAEVFSDVVENPTTLQVAAGRQAAEELGADLLIALGGGSALDCAKGINFLLTNGGRMEDYWGFGKATQPMLPSIGVPTTAGTGSEAQSYALISQAETHRKMACGDRKARFRTVLLDPELLASAPRAVAAVAGIDALSHAVESYVTLRRTPVSQMLARESWSYLKASFAPFLARPSDLEAAGGMLLGAHLAGAAIEASMLGAAHACANPLTARYGIAHGTAVALILPHVIRFNAETAGERYRGLGEPEEIAGRIETLREIAGLPARLRQCGVEPAHLPELAAEAAEQWTAGFNPRPVTADDLRKLYEAAW